MTGGKAVLPDSAAGKPVAAVAFAHCESATPTARQALAAILHEIDRHGPQGHWLSRGSRLVFHARQALQNGEWSAGRMEAALRDLIQRVEQARFLIERGMAGEEATLLSLLDATDGRQALLSDAARSDPSPP